MSEGVSIPSARHSPPIEQSAPDHDLVRARVERHGGGRPRARRRPPFRIAQASVYHFPGFAEIPLTTAIPTKRKGGAALDSPRILADADSLRIPGNEVSLRILWYSQPYHRRKGGQQIRQES